MIKFLHFADVHLDSPFSLCDIKQAEQRRQELRAAFTSAMTYVRTNGVKYVLIPGDLFDYDFVTKETVSIVLREFSVNPTTRFIIAPGNHDPYIPDSVWERTSFPDNVYIFDREELSVFEFPDDNLDIYGYAFTSKKLSLCPFAGMTVTNPSHINILLGHADNTSAISDSCPVCERDIELFGADYTALGHIHNTDGVHTVGENHLWAYSGCLEGRSFDECGHKGAILLELDGESRRMETKFCCFSHRRYAVEQIDVTGAGSDDVVASKVSERVSAKRYGQDTVLRVVLTGSVPPSLSPNVEKIKAYLASLYGAEVLDRTMPLFDDDILKNDLTIRGEFYRTMLPKLTSSDRRERECAAWALRYGLSALSGENITDF